MTSYINPDYRYYSLLNHRWQSDDGSFACTISDSSIALETPYGSFNDSYLINSNIIPGGNTGLGMMGLFETYYPGEEFSLNLSSAMNPAIRASMPLRIKKLWYGAETLHLVYLSPNGEETEAVMRICDQPKSSEDWECACGYTGPKGNFCPNCGAARLK